MGRSRWLSPSLSAPLLACAVALAWPALATAGQGSLPSVKSGQRPGPPLLYAKAPKAPILSVKAPFRAAPLLVSGTDAYRSGEYVYQDYLFDDRGADRIPLEGLTSDLASHTAGELIYPAGDKYANNAADLVELRIRPTARSLLFRITLNTVKAPDASVVGIGFDTDRSGGAAVPWPRGAGITSPGIDRFLTVWGTGGEVTDLRRGSSQRLGPRAVRIDTTTNQMTVEVPRSMLDPKRERWRLVAGVGLWNGEGWMQAPAGREAREDGPVSGGLVPSPGVFNLAFRFDEPQNKGVRAGSTSFPGVGNWFEDAQAQALSNSTSGRFAANVDFAALADGSEGAIHPPRRDQARIFASSLTLPEGRSLDFPEIGGQLQPYMLTVPRSYKAGKPSPLTFSLHSLGGLYTQYSVFSPNQLRQFGDQRDSLVATPMGRGPDGWYTSEAEADFFEVWADVARRFDLDPERVALSGYSMGGYGTYKLATQYPDLFGRAFTTVGPPALGLWIPGAQPPTIDEDSNSYNVLENVRWVPFLNWVMITDELVPYLGPQTQQRRFDELGLRSSLVSMTPGEHYTLAILDQWATARDFLGSSRVKRDPWRVNYAVMPSADRPKLGLQHDHAYWVSGLRARSLEGDPASDPVRGEIDARSLAHGQSDPQTTPFGGGELLTGLPVLGGVEGTTWGETPTRAPENTLELDMTNLSSATIDGRRAKLDPRRPLRVVLRSDGASRLRLVLPFARGTRVSSTGPAPAPFVRVGRRGATLVVYEGEARTVTLTPPRR